MSRACMSPPDEVSRLLARARDGDGEALDRLVPLVYDQLCLLARGQRRRTGADETVNTTALVHEAYEKLAGREGGWNDRRHFFLVAARAMRDVLIDYARAQRAEKRGGDQRALSLADIGAELFGDPSAVRVDEVLDLENALKRLRELDSEAADLVELRYFAGLTNEEAAQTLGVSERTAKRRWVFARAWLHRELRSPGDFEGS